MILYAYAQPADPVYFLRPSSIRQLNRETPFCSLYKAPAWGYSVAITSGKPFRVDGGSDEEGYSEGMVLAQIRPDRPK